MDDYRDSDGIDAVDDVPLPQHRRKIFSDSGSSDDEGSDADGSNQESEEDEGSDSGSEDADAEGEIADDAKKPPGSAELGSLGQIIVPSLIDEDLTFDSREVESFIYNFEISKFSLG